ncbi:MAG TPA: hypothetical protein VNA29_02140 [Sphingomicrobium sp.]|nr:hypothetical protein [Sphingomicrobium sp.]
MISAPAPVSASHEGRQQPRTHLFVAATLYADRGSTPVHIRNMSQTGALVEGEVLPDVGVRVALKRGRLHAVGWIAWRVERKAGVRLEAAVDVSDWMSRPGSNGQQQVDALLSIVSSDEPNASLPTAGNGEVSIETELALLRTDLSGLGAALTADVVLVATHPEIQAIDISLQRVDRIVRLLRTGG